MLTRENRFAQNDNIYNTTVEFASKIDACCLRGEALNGAFALRHEVFAEELAWVPRNDSSQECDVHDKYAEHFGVMRGNRVLAYLRLVVNSHRYMLEKEFSNLVSPGYVFRKSADTREVSRLCVRSSERSTKVHTDIGMVRLSMLLYRKVYQWCLGESVRYLYLVVEHKVFRLLKMCGFPCKLIGEPVRMPDGVVAVAAMMDWRIFEAKNSYKRPELMEWFNQDRSVQDVLPLQQPVVDLRNRAFA